MSKIVVTADTIEFTRDGKTDIVTIGFNPTTARNEWVLVSNDKEQGVVNKKRKFTAKNPTKLLTLVSEWFATEGVEVVRDYSASMAENQWNDQEESADKYSGTPGYLPIYVGSGRIAHVGDGVWLTRCNHCNLSMTHYGMMQRYATTGQHEVDVHDGVVSGLNVGMLS